MKILKSLLLIILVFTFILSCGKENNNTKTANSTTLAANYKKTAFHINGMTCEIGCARLIQSKLSKTEGVKFVKVNFKDSLGMVEYDTNILSQNKINSIVSNIAGGDLYKVIDSKEVTDFPIQK